MGWAVFWRGAIVREARRLKPPAKLAGGEGASGWGGLGLELGGLCAGGVTRHEWRALWARYAVWGKGDGEVGRWGR